ncbi:MAG: hypothetical protein GAK30_00757 [Paracidovorax wautersii]|uniref:DUF2147 domain-containing protein n=1 Tax=Paracidovorax wautersii TaxID=1177982 RepID=A0A7V8FR66_9BURK|nr:MAG: hypothetical protein GAK30_00757 [Paracidovorax wautersii]
MKATAASIALALAAAAVPAWAQLTPVGTWRSIDDKTGEAKSEIVITEQGGVLTGHITRLLRKEADPNARCTECSDDRRDQPLVGLEIIRGARQADGKDVWEDGKILDPENGKTYTLRLTPKEGGRQLDVRGSIGPFGRTQTWVRVAP